MANKTLSIPIWVVIVEFIITSIFLLAIAYYNGHRDVIRGIIILIVASGFLSLLCYKPGMKFKEKRRRRGHDLKSLFTKKQ